MKEPLYDNNFAEPSLNPIVQLNQLAIRKKMLIKFEKHPESIHGTILHLGRQKYEAHGSSLKEARIKACVNALEKENLSENDQKNNSPVYISPISELMEIAQKFDQTLKFEYTPYVDDLGTRGFECFTRLNNYTESAKNISKKKAKEDCCNNMLIKLKSLDADVENNIFYEEILNLKLNKLDINEEIKHTNENEDLQITPRDYQKELFNKCINNNSIICLGTGCGKTFIAVMLIRYYAFMTRGSINDGHKRIIFLVPTTALLYQQSAVIKKNVSLTVGSYCGDIGADSWDTNKWLDEIEKHKVLVMTGELFRSLLQHSIINISQVCLLIFDECHHAINSGHYYNMVMTTFYHHAMSKETDLPRIIGLTATPVVNLDAIKDVSVYQISQQILKLEEIYLSKCLTSVEFIPTLKKFTADFKINVVLYDDNDKTVSLENHVINKINKYIRIFELKKTESDVQTNSDREFNSCLISQYNNIDSKIEISASQNNSVRYECTLDGEKISNIFIKSLLRSKIILYELGIFPLFTYLKSVCINLKLMLKSPNYVKFTANIEKFAFYIEKLSALLNLKIKSIIDVLEKEDIPSICCTGLVTSKVSTLVGVLLKHYSVLTPTSHRGPKLYSTIVFVKDRSSAAVLSSFINKLSTQEAISLNCSQRFVSSYVVGVSDCSLHRRLVGGLEEMSLKIMNARLDNFSHGSFDILFSTNVLEEGIDVNTCNMVIRFDPFTGIQSYCQSKGRARVLNSHFYVIESRKNIAEVRQKLNVLAKVEKTLANVLLNFCDNMFQEKGEPVNISSLSTDECRLVTPTSVMDIRGAISYINKYVSKYSYKYSYIISPIYFMKNDGMYCQVILRLPPETKIYEDIYSDWLLDEKIAKQHCSLKAIKLLYSKRLIDDNFLPILPKNQIRDLPKLDKVENVVTDRKIEVEKSNWIVETSSHDCTNLPNNYYQKCVSKTLTKIDNPNNVFYLSKIIFSDYSSCKVAIKYGNIIDNPSLRLGLLTFGKMEDFSFPLASSFQSLHVRIEHAFGPCISLSDNQLEKILKFNESLYKKLWKIVPDECIWDIQNCHYYILIVLIDDDHLCLDKMESYLHFQEDLANNENQMSESNKPSSEASTTLGATAVCKSYSNDNTTYIVAGTNEVKPFSIINDLNKTFAQYYNEKYGIKLNGNDDMLSCIALPGVPNMLKKVMHVRTVTRGCIYIPSKCTFPHVFCSSLLFKLSIVPSIIKRVTDFVTIYDWAKSILKTSLIYDKYSNNLDSFVHKLSDPIKSSVKSNINRSFNQFYYFLDKYCKNSSQDSPVSFYCVFQALTRESSIESCNYERMECLGDSFIKFICTALLFSSNNSSEGELTFQRDQLISNNHFLEIGKSLQIQHILNSKPINFGKNWCPPGFYCFQNIAEYTLDEAIMYQYIPEKSIADVIESLVGCVLLNSNFSQALKFMIRIKIFEHSQLNCCSENYSELLSKLSYTKNLNVDLSDFYMEIDFIEDALNYKFNNKYILTEALTHSSYLKSPDQKSYERLEFLGDAVIGFLVTLYLYLCHEEWQNETFSPYQMSHLQHALVNNTLLGIISIRYGFAKCLKYKSSHLYESISQVSSIIEGIEVSSELKEVPFLGLICKSQQLIDIPSKRLEVKVISIPKPASDVFEAIIAAVFVDTNFDLVATSKVFFPLFQNYINEYLNNFPVHPKCYVLENYPNIFQTNVKLRDNLFQSILQLPGAENCYSGISTTSKSAYLASCYCLMNEIEANLKPSNSLK